MAQTPSLKGTTWRLVRFQSGDGTTIKPDDQSKYTIAFGDDGSANARVDCNRGRSSWKSDGSGHLEFGPLALTRAFCPPAPLNNLLAKDWQSLRSYAVKVGHLFLSTAADASTYEFEPASEDKAPLENTYWKVILLRGKPVTVGSTQQELNLVLNSDSRRASGSGGCNRFTGGYELKGDSLTFGRVASTMMACVEGGDIESAFLESLAQVKTWKISGQHLELYDSGNQMVIRLEAVKK